MKNLKSIRVPCRAILLLPFILLRLLSWCQVIPLPLGKYGIGHHHFEWTDSSRTEVLAPDGGPRKLVADVWYPAEKSPDTAVPYLDTLAIYHALGKEGLQSFLGKQGALTIRSDDINTHAHEDAAFDHRLASAPVILFSHGMGMITQLYTTQIEDLASHGYIVVALTHPYDAWLVPLSNGSAISFEINQRNTAGTTEEQQIAYENKRVDWWASDISFAIDQLISMQGHPDSLPFASHLDLTRIGAMGHSAGGRAAARACQLDARIKSCADQDGVAMMQPFYTDAHGVGMRQRFLIFERVRNAKLNDDDARSLGMTLTELNALVTNLRQKKQKALRATGGSFHVLLDFGNSSHMSFSDLPLLQAIDDGQEMKAHDVLRTTCRYTREFFDKTLRNIPAPLYESAEKLKYIELVEEVHR
ncbi:MAG: hypothetical protein QM762_14555 [Chryseolinea sp.]